MNCILQLQKKSDWTFTVILITLKLSLLFILFYFFTITKSHFMTCAVWKLKERFISTQ